MESVAKVRCVFIVILGFAYGGCAKDPIGSDAVIEIVNPICDLGAIEANREVQQSFTVRNLSNRRVVIDRILQSCGCTSARLGPSSTLEPLEEARLDVVVRNEITSAKRVNVELTSSLDPSVRAVAQLRFTTMPGCRITAVPKRIEIELHPTEERWRYAHSDSVVVEVTSALSDPIDEVRIEMEGPVRFGLSEVDVDELEGVRSRKFRLDLLKIDRDAVVQGWSGALTVRADGEDAPEQLEVPVTLSIGQALTATPRSLFLGGFSVNGGKITRTVRLAGFDGETVEGELSVESSADWIEARVRRRGSEARIEVIADPASKTDAETVCDETLVLRSDEKPVLRIPILGRQN